MKTKKRQIEFRNLQAEQSSKGAVAGNGNPKNDQSPSSENSPAANNNKDNNNNNSPKTEMRRAKSRTNDAEGSASGEEKEIMLSYAGASASQNHESRSKLKKFFKHLVDKEEEDDVDVTVVQNQNNNNNELSTTMSCEATTYRPSSITNETVNRTNKSSLDTAAGIVEKQPASASGIFGLISRLCKGSTERPENTANNIDYAKCKLVCKSSRTMTGTAAVSSQCLKNASYKYSDTRYSLNTPPGRYSILGLFARFNDRRANVTTNEQAIKKPTPQIKLCKFSDDDISFAKADDNEPSNGHTKNVFYLFKL